MTKKNRRNEPKCNICGSGSSWLMNKKSYELFMCNSCSHIFIYPSPSEEDLKGLYSFKDGYHVQDSFIFPETYIFKKKFVTAIEKINLQISKGTILDVGCSNGEFCVLAKRRGYIPLGIEINPDTAIIAMKNDINVKIGELEDLKLFDNNFDIAYLGDVIEHVRDVHSIMEELKRLLKQGGVLFIQTPNHEAFFPKQTLYLHQHYGIPWSHPTPPHHLNQFTPESIGKLLEMHNFSVSEYYYTKCSLSYELGATYVFTELKHEIKNGNILSSLKKAFKAIAVLFTYIPIWLLDRCVKWKRDVNMNVMAIKK